MKNLIKVLMVAAVCFLYFVAISLAQSMQTVPYPEGYRNWTHVKSEIVTQESRFFAKYGGLHHIYANSKAMEGYRTGNFPDGSVIVFDLLGLTSKDGNTSEGSRVFIDVMHKDSKRFAKTGGWGYEEFKGDSSTERLLTEETANKCAACHASQKDNVFSSFRN